jgi:Tfp pilus assembly protein FimT
VPINKSIKNTVSTLTAGFTTIELLIIIAVLGIVSAIAAPSWLMFINNQRLKVSIDRAYWAMELAQSNAKRDKTSWQATFKQVGDTVQVAVHKSEIPPAQVPVGEWKSLESKIQIHKDETTFVLFNEQNKYQKDGNIRRAMFNYRGCPVYNSSDECGLTSFRAKATLTLFHPNLKNSERCVIISTILGHQRVSQKQRKPNEYGRYCY